MKRLLLGTSLFLFSSFVNGISVTVSVQNQLCSTPGSCYANVTGGVAPYTYLWNTGATTAGINGLVVGTYSVTVTDAVSDQATANAVVILTDHSALLESFFGSGVPADAFCPDDLIPSPFFRWSPDAGIEGFGQPPYLFDGNPPMQDPWQGQEMYHVSIPAAPGETVEMQFLDGDGCPGTFSVTAGYPVEWPSTSVLNVEGTCSGGSTGTITVAYSEEAHNYSVGTEVRNMQDEIVLQGGFYWHGYQAETEVFSGLAAGDYRLIQRLTMAEGSLYYEWCSNEVVVNVPDLGVTCGNVNGTVYMDYNMDCALGTANAETRVPGALLEFTPGPHYATADGVGAYSIDLPSGSYSLQQIASGVAQHCPAPPSALTVSSGTQTLNIADTALVALDAQVMFSSGAARPGFELRYAILQRNLTPASTGATSTVFTFDPAVSYISASPTPTSVVGNTLTWNQAALGAFQERTIQVRLQVPPDLALIGTILNATVTLGCANSDVDLVNNSASTSVTVTGSYDPNDKRALTNAGSSDAVYVINSDEWVDYTIRFQNTGTDTAFNVIITDTLPAALDPSSIIWGAASHGCSRSLVGQGILKFTFANIQLPDSNVNEAASHGFISFRIKPRDPVLPGTAIENIANIYFDFNEPVITEPSVLVAEFSTGAEESSAPPIQVWPTPADDLIQFRVTEDVISIALHAADGRLVRSMPVRSTTARMSVADLREGLYVIVANTREGTAQTRRTNIIHH